MENADIWKINVHTRIQYLGENNPEVKHILGAECR